MGVAGLIFEPHSSNFENDFLISLLVSDFQRLAWSVPSISVAVLGLFVVVNGQTIVENHKNQFFKFDIGSGEQLQILYTYAKCQTTISKQILYKLGNKILRKSSWLDIWISSSTILKPRSGRSN